MVHNYDDFVDAMYEVRRKGETVDQLILSDETMETFLVDGKFSEETEQKHDQLGEFNVELQQGDGDYILTGSGDRVPL